jgi:hypothetical protein
VITFAACYDPVASHVCSLSLGQPASREIVVMTVFVSYSSRDEAPVQQLLSAFRLANEQIWWDEELGGGESWWQKILAEIRECEVFVLALSQHSLDSKSCQAELRYAQDLGKPVLPVQIGSVDSMRASPFAAIHVVDYRKPAVDTALRLIADVRRAKRHPLPDPLPAEPPMPYAYLMRLKSDIAAPQLIPQEQVQVLSELKAGLDEDGADASARADITRLLQTLRARSDTTPDTRTAIDSVLTSLGVKPPGAPRFSRKLALAGAALLVAVVAVVVFVTVSGRDGATLVTAAQLETILLSTEELDPMGASNLDEGAIDVKTFDNEAVAEPPECVAMFYSFDDSAYKDSGYTDSRTQPVKAETSVRVVGYQSAIRFSSPAQATAFLRELADEWKACSEHLVEVTEISQPSGAEVKSTWRATPLDDKGSQIAETVTRDDGSAACQHVLRAESNVIIDVLVCGDQVSNQAERIVAQMGSKVTNLVG